MTGTRGAPGRRLNHPEPWGLMSFYANDEQPWVGFNLSAGTLQPGNHVNPTGVRRGNPAAFAGWRSSGPSESGTVPHGYLPSDSGYESRAKHSIDDRSVYDENQDTQSLSGHLMDYHPFQSGNTYARDTPVPHWQQVAPVPVASGTTEKQLICPDCNTLCKTKSELNKHHQRHRKAYKCDVHGCTRREGFGTLNDLERHKSSVHPERHNGGARYRCNMGSCSTKDKIWPRADNFRQHLKRVHHKIVQPDDDLSDFIYQPPQKPQEQAIDLEGVGSDLSAFAFGAVPSVGAWDGRSLALEDVQLPSAEQSMGMDDLVLDPSLSSVEETSTNMLLGPQAISLVVCKAQDQHDPDLMMQSHHEYVQPREVSRPASKTLVVGQADARSDVPRGLRSQNASSRPNTITQGSPKDSMSTNMDCEPKMDLDDLSGGETNRVKHSLLASSADGINEQDVVKLLDKLPKSLIEKYLKTQSDNTAKAVPTPPNTTEIGHKCSASGCNKAFARKCELKKHMKRHDKPYGCTFAGCKKKFGSKNDWKRHENSQHFQLEVWKCDEKRAEDDGGNSSSSDTCGKVCHRRETFRNHLLKEHKMEDSARIDTALENCRVGRNCESRFWCGFCVSIIEITKKGANAWTERFNHIDNHYAGRDNAPKKDISEWKNVDPELQDMDFAGSSYDSSDADSGDEIAILRSKAAAPVRVMNSSDSKKRSLEDDNNASEQRDPKRLKNASIALMWLCCGCRVYADAKLHELCIECSHRRCSNCEVEEVLVNDEKSRL
ncbi:C2H2 type zinc finger domain protein [Colletotrichum truncatum]|uniref:C2H2 type zinc finger domain protein n=1 Tax=Colletotrichum truncatum TaxID=5467 RepID=A0ACC3ZEF7_COLTU